VGAEGLEPPYCDSNTIIFDRAGLQSATVKHPNFLYNKKADSNFSEPAFPNNYY